MESIDDIDKKIMAFFLETKGISLESALKYNMRCTAIDMCKFAKKFYEQTHTPNINISNVVWNKYPDVLPENRDDEDEIAGNNFLCRLEHNFGLPKYEVCEFDYEDKIFLTAKVNNVYHSVGKITGWVRFNGR